MDELWERCLWPCGTQTGDVAEFRLRCRRASFEEKAILYLNNKGVGRTRRNVKKASCHKAVTADEWQRLLQACEDTAPTNRRWRRDYAIVFLAAALGLRRAEVAILERSHFRDMDNCLIHAPTVKQAERIRYTCKNCGKRCRVRASAAGTKHECAKCSVRGIVDTPEGHLISGVVELDLDVVEENTISFLQNYLEKLMRPDQRYLFEGHGRKPISLGHLNCIFNTYANLAGVDPNVSFHSLRHNRGVKVWSEFHDIILTMKALRHKNSKTTEIYANLDVEQKAEYKARLQKKAFNPLKKGNWNADVQK